MSRPPAPRIATLERAPLRDGRAWRAIRRAVAASLQRRAGAGQTAGRAAEAIARRVLQSGPGDARTRLGSPRHRNAAGRRVADRRPARPRRLRRASAGSRSIGTAAALGLVIPSGWRIFRASRAARPDAVTRRAPARGSRRAARRARPGSSTTSALASRKGDRTALALALDEMRTLAFTPRYWVRYLTLIQHPLARIVDLLVIKQGDKIARQKGWSPDGPGRAGAAPRRHPAREGPAPEPAGAAARRSGPAAAVPGTLGQRGSGRSAGGTPPVRGRACRGRAGPAAPVAPGTFPGRPKRVSFASTANATASLASGSSPTSASERTGTGASAAAERRHERPVPGAAARDQHLGDRARGPTVGSRSPPTPRRTG